MKEGDVILAQLSQADGRAKIRPAVILREMPWFRDLLVCGVSTQLHLHVEGFDDLILPEDVDFVDSGLVAASLIRLGFVTVLPRNNIPGVIGSISPARHRKLLKCLSEYLIRP